jgi:hypothetical protein
MSFSGPTTLLNAVGATGAGTAMGCADRATAAFQLLITGTATVTVQGTIDGTNWVTVRVRDVATGTAAATATASSIVQAGVAGLKSVRPNVTAWTSGTVTVLGTTQTEPLGNA